MSAKELEGLLRTMKRPETTAVPPHVAVRIESALQQLPDRRSLRRRTVRLRRLAVGIAAIALFGGAFAGYEGYMNNRATPTVDEPVQSFMSAGADRSDVIRERAALGAFAKEGSETAEGSVTNQGITLKVGNIVFDGRELAFRYSVVAESPLESFALEAEIKLNGVVVGSLGSNPGGTLAKLGNSYERLESGAYEGVAWTEYLAYKAIPSQRQLKLTIEATKIGTVSGRWSLDVPGEYVSQRTYLDSRESRTSEYGTIELYGVALSALSTKIDYSFTEGKLKSYERVGVDVIDDTGFRYGAAVFNFSQSDKASGPPSYPPAAREAKRLIIRPFYYDARLDYDQNVQLFRTTMADRPTEHQPLAVPMGEAGHVYVTDIEYLPDQTVIHSFVKPEDSGGGYKLEDENGQEVPFVTWGAGGIARFGPVEPGSKLTFVSRPYAQKIYLPAMEIRVDLPSS
ncbi:hypothetical protein [Cohnella boryungensis]|uniref:DUF4179 domain-containing protein n=1 Tax=Cohnella boryungensis TaxID=768479 RepID=A0ABV8SDQ1_9BACL